MSYKEPLCICTMQKLSDHRENICTSTFQTKVADHENSHVL